MPDTPVAPRPPTVLIVEDNPEFRASIADLLAESGFTVAAAENGEEALGYLRVSRLPDLIVLDLMMPVMNGWAFAEELKRDPVLRRIPLVVVSALGEDEEALRRLDAVAY